MIKAAMLEMRAKKQSLGDWRVACCTWLDFFVKHVQKPTFPNVKGAKNDSVRSGQPQWGGWLVSMSQKRLECETGAIHHPEV